APFLDRAPGHLEVGLVLEPDEVRTVTGVEQELVRREQLEQHAADHEEAGVPLGLRHVGHELRPAESAEGDEARLDVLEHHVHVLTAHRMDRCRHLSRPPAWLTHCSAGYPPRGRSLAKCRTVTPTGAAMIRSPGSVGGAERPRRTYRAPQRSLAR